jgi:hypothetical protein
MVGFSFSWQLISIIGLKLTVAGMQLAMRTTPRVGLTKRSLDQDDAVERACRWSGVIQRLMTLNSDFKWKR